ncbi:hypothetical protein F4808DRAFT_459792 [Astrocystis sublimbata]|nr:hypothetical protein F4808DRAFT_459792 [Astrocystis sublimbata]
MTLDGESYNFDAGMAGCEWAAYLRVRHSEAIVLRVYPRNRTAKGEDILCQIISSLIYNLATLVPDTFSKVDGLAKSHFETLKQGGTRGISAGIEIIESLPELKIPSDKILWVVDAMNLAEGENTSAGVKNLKVGLQRLLARRKGHLLYTIAKKRH